MTRKSTALWLAFSVLLIVVAAIILVLPVTERRPGFPAKDTDDARSLSGRYIVKKIIDGDTFVLADDTQIRLIGVDTPEKGQPYYENATLFADSLLLGKEVILRFDEELYDNYGRQLAYVYIDSVFFNESVVAGGMGSVYLFPHNRKFASELIRAQKIARTNRTGIWSLDAPSREDYYVSVEGSLRFHRPLCIHLKDTDPERLRRFSTRDEPLDLGLSPCRFCRP